MVHIQFEPQNLSSFITKLFPNFICWGQLGMRKNNRFFLKIDSFYPSLHPRTYLLTLLFASRGDFFSGMYRGRNANDSGSWYHENESFQAPYACPQRVCCAFWRA
uniref:Uncharacterized protein n=1 Tax=Cacopsylla melanoneura TaxID=428564 RepID=A0A8D8WU24_9HEMI